MGFKLSTQAIITDPNILRVKLAEKIEQTFQQTHTELLARKAKTSEINALYSWHDTAYHASAAPDSGRGQNHRQPWPKDRFPEHDRHHDLERGRRADQTPNGDGLWRDRRPRIVRGNARQDSGRIKTGV